MRRVRWAGLLEEIAYWLLLGVLVLPQWTNRVFLTQDGPMHLASARILLDHLRSAPTDLFNAYYVPNLFPFPYWFSHLSVAALVAVFPPFVAEKVYLTAYVLLFGLLIRLLVKDLGREGSLLSFLALPLVCNRPFQMGFFSFSFSVVFLLVLVRYWLRNEGSMTGSTKGSMKGRKVIVLSLLFLLVYFCHPTTYLFSAALLGCLALASSFEGWDGGGPGAAAALRTFAGRALCLSLALVPSLVLLAAFLRRAPRYRMGTGLTYPGILGNFVAQDGLVLVTTREALLAAGVTLLFGVALAAALVDRLRSPRIERRDGFLVAAVVALALHVLGSAHLLSFLERMQAVPLLVLVPWLGTRAWSRASLRALALAAGLLVLALSALRFPVYAKASEAVADGMSVASSIAARSTVLPLIYAQGGIDGEGKRITDVLPLFVHACDYLGAEPGQVLVLTNIGGRYANFPFRWRPERNPYVFIGTNGEIEGQPPVARFLRYPEETGGSVDYVLTWGIAASDRNDPRVRAVQDQLERGYDLVATSPGRTAVLYRLSPAKSRQLREAGAEADEAEAAGAVRR